MTMNEYDVAKARKRLGILIPDRSKGDLLSPTTRVGQRLFQTVQMDNSRYLAYEFRPTGMVIQGETSDGKMIIDHERQDEIKAAYSENPNGFLTWLEEQNLNPDDVPMFGGGYSINRIEFQTLDDAISAILSAVDANELLPQYTDA